MTLGEQFKKQVATARPHDSIQHAVRLMRDHGVGAVVVVNDKEHDYGHRRRHSASAPSGG